jgi:Uma2 family endonuclease
MSISFHDVERLQALYPENQVELREGRLTIMSPSDGISGSVGIHFSRLLANWVYDHKLGEVLDASTGFRLPNGDLLSPDVSFVSRARMKHITRSYLAVVPELVVEIKSSSDRVRELEEKIALFLRQGVQVGILIDPDKRRVMIYRGEGTVADDDAGQIAMQKTVLQGDDVLTIPDLFPGWEAKITDFWPIDYEE